MMTALSKKERLIRYFHEMLEEEEDAFDSQISAKAESAGKSLNIKGTAIRISIKNIPEPLTAVNKAFENQGNCDGEGIGL
jgi:hypothetical protein